jgi:hypothetical protein
MTEDHLDKETSVSVDVTPTGFSARIKSRFLSAIDRLGGNVLERRNASMEAEAAEIRAKTTANVKLIEAVTELGIEQLKANPEIAARAMETHLGVVFRRQENKDAVVAVAIEDLRTHPPNEEEATTGGERLTDDFLNRFERYAEDATSEELRAKWGKILAAETRKPGTFSSKVMRVVDELASSSAVLFEGLCRHRIADTIVKCLAGDLSFADRAALVTAGLILDPGMAGHIRRFVEGQSSTGDAMWVTDLGPAAVAIPRPLKQPATQRKQNILTFGDQPAIPIYALTDVGHAVSSIFEDHQADACTAYLDRLSNLLTPQEVQECRKLGDNTLALVRAIRVPVQKA